MGKKRSWFGLVKRLFETKPKSKDRKRSKGWRWNFRRDNTKRYPALLAPPKKTINDVREEQRKQAVAVAIAMAAAAEAAVAAARAASEVVHLTGFPQSFEKYEKRTRISAAIKIQAAYRGHLARKALKALKGLVRLQALVRGRIARRQIFNKLSCLRCSPPTMTQHQMFQDMRFQNIDENCKDQSKKQILSLKEELEEERKKFRCNSQKNWDHSLFSKEDLESSWLRKQEGSLKRERIKKYSYSHRETRNDQDLEIFIPTTESKRWGNRIEKKREMCNLKSELGLNSISTATYEGTKLKLTNAHKHDSLEEQKFPFALPRRSFCHLKHKSFGGESSLPNSPNFPTYMAATESVKAKMRSTSTPRQRFGLFDTYVDYNSPCKARLSTWSSFNGDFGSNNGRRLATELISLSINGPH